MRYLKAPLVFSSHTGFIENGILVLHNNGTVADLIDPAVAASVPEHTELHDGLLCPGFVNTHCHLELSHLRGEIAEHTGFSGFAKELIPKRGKFTPEQISEAARLACEELYTNGVTAVGDIANTSDSFSAKQNSPLHIHTFIELLALNPALAEKVMSSGKQLLAECPQPASLTPHAPYSVSEELLRAIADDETETPFSIHNQESKAENEFFETGAGRVNELFEFLGIDISWYKAPGVNAIRRTLPHLLSKRPLILVHNTFTSAADLAWAESLHTNLHWCFCPNANLYIENSLPDFMQFYKAGVRCCIGTDSLASNHQLSVLSELKVISQQAPEIPAADLLTWATSNGAAALRFGDTGSFETGKKPGVILLSGVDAKTGISQNTSVKRLY
ncbi:MAG: amidohydrolase family protein [Bacteroidia bacterium]